MHLWNDYEGTTIAGRWTLGRLLRTEGRSALFATERPDGGGSAVLRLTEALNDQAVLGARYRAIQAAGDEFLVKVESFGDAEFDGTPLSYAVLEPTQESLAEILATRRLAVDETQEVATSVAGGLLALHGQGLVHGLVEPESVMAAGDRIKLRSDCARPAPHGDDALLENAVTPQADAFGLAGVIYHSLTQNRLHDAADALALPEPYATIVRNAARGAWGIPEIADELKRHGRGSVAAAPAPVVRNAPVRESAPAAEKLLSSRASVAPAEAEESGAWSRPERVSAKRRRGVAIAAMIVVVLILLFVVFHHRTRPAPAIGTSTTSIAPGTAMPVPEPAPEAHTAGPTAPEANGTATGQKVWRVVAYTYNRKDKAEAKAASLNQQYPGFNAEAWSRSGQKPFLVTLGGEMEKKQAFALRYKARKSGVAPDVYAQNYAR